MRETITIEKTNPIFKLLSWVFAARSEDPTRYFIHGFFIENDGKDQLWVATDGRRLHLHRHVDGAGCFPPGNTRIDVFSKTLIAFTSGCDDMGQFPNWRRVVPTIADELGTIKNKDGGNIVINIGKMSLRGVDAAPLGRLVVKLYVLTDRIINPFYLLPLADARWELYGDNGASQREKALEFHSDWGIAVIQGQSDYE